MWALELLVRSYRDDVGVAAASKSMSPIPTTLNNSDIVRYCVILIAYHYNSNIRYHHIHWHCANKSVIASRSHIQCCGPLLLLSNVRCGTQSVVSLLSLLCGAEMISRKVRYCFAAAGTVAAVAENVSECVLVA